MAVDYKRYVREDMTPHKLDGARYPATAEGLQLLCSATRVGYDRLEVIRCAERLARIWARRHPGIHPPELLTFAIVAEATAYCQKYPERVVDYSEPGELESFGLGDLLGKAGKSDGGE